MVWEGGVTLAPDVKLWYNKKNIWSLSPVPGTELLKPLEIPE